ncbi:MAG: IclR family transcriptional regulator [Comamonadaceae bacterium]|nr:MAG: IclR family transcriptional regulator [Comamonadaceae bacterium]
MAIESSSKPGQLIGSFDKGLAILDFIVHADTPQRLQDVANHLEIDKSSALRFLATLEKHALIRRQPHDKTYVIGTRLLMWSKDLKAGNSIVERVRPHLRRLTALTGQTSHLAVLREDRVVLIEVVASESAVSVRQIPGDWEPLYSTAVGKAILAFLPMVEQRKIIEQIEFREFTERTISTREMLRVELTSVLHERVAYDDAEMNLQIGCIAAPLLDRSGFPIASVGISTISALHPGGPRAQRHLVTAVKQVAQETMLALRQS